MPVKKLLIGTSKAKEVYVGTDKVKLIYLDTKCVFASPRTITISKGTGLNSVTVNVTEKDGSTHSTTVTSSSQSIEVGYGASVTFTTAAASYYTASSSNVSSATVTADTTYTFSASKVGSCTVYVRTRYNSSTSNASKVGTISGSYIDYSTLTTKTFSSQYSTTLTVPVNSAVSFTSYSAVAGFKAPSTKSTTITSNGQYVYADFTAQNSTSSITWSYANTTTTNTLTKNAFNVTATININFNAFSAGTTIGTIPAAYRPASNKTQKADESWFQGTTGSGVTISNTYANPTFTFGSNGNVTCDILSKGTTQVGAYKSSVTTTVYATYNETVTWTVT